MQKSHRIPERYLAPSGDVDTQKVRSEFRLSDIIRTVIPLRKCGTEFVGLCPFHKETTPSFFVNDDRGLYICFGCNCTGDAIQFIRQTNRSTFREAVEYLVGTGHRIDPPFRPQQEFRIRAAKRALTIGQARGEWLSAAPVAGTLAATYLLSRGIHLPLPETLRFSRTPVRFHEETGAPINRRPALIGACQDIDGRITGIHRTFLGETGDKARMFRPKLSLGTIRGGALRLGPAAKTLMLCEGVEDGLSLMMMRPGIPVWVALGASNLAHIVLPDFVEHVILAGDANSAGRKAVDAATIAYEDQQFAVDAIFPSSGFEDFNDELRGIRRRLMEDEGHA